MKQENLYSSNQVSKEVNDLIENNLVIVNKVVGKFMKTHSTGRVEKEELIGVGNIGLVKAAQNFDKDRGFVFSTYAGKVIENEVKMYLRKELPTLNKTEFYQATVFTNKDGDELTLEDKLPSDINIEEDYLKYEEYQILHEAINELDEDEKEILCMYFGLYGKKYTGEEIGKIYGISQSWISRKIKSSIKTLKMKLTKTSSVKIKKINI